MSKKKAAAPAVTGMDMLTQLVKTTPKAVTKSNKAELVLAENIQEHLRTWAGLKTVKEAINEKEKTAKKDLQDEILDAYLDNAWKQRCKPANPVVTAKNENGQLDCESLFICTENFKVQVPLHPNDQTPQSAMVELFANMGVERASAVKLVTEEIDFTPKAALRPFNELLKGHKNEDGDWVDATEEEVALGTEILQFVMGLPDEKRQLALVANANVSVKNGFAERVFGYCKSVVDFKNIYKVIKPVNYLKGAKFAANDLPAVKNKRLTGVVASVLPDMPTDTKKADK